MRRKSFLALVGSVLAAPTLRAQTTPTRLRLAHASAESDSQHLAALRFAERVKERSGGSLQVQVYPNSMLGNDNTALSGTRGGTIDMVLIGNPYYTGLMPELNALDLPYLFKDAAHAYRVLDGAIGQRLLGEFGKFRLQGLAFWEVGFRSVANSRRPIQRAEDLRGLKIRTTPNPAHIRAFQLLGANPQPMPYAEVYPALESGALDGHENPPIIMLASKMYEVQKYLSLTRHAYTAMPLSINKARFDRLPPPQRAILQEEAVAAAHFQREHNQRTEPHVLAELKSQQVQVIEQPDTDSLRRVVRDDTRKLFTEKQGDGLLKAIEAQ
ncbi:MAG: DctP family TRAP transporter solute-binding subunit [Pseudomonadota bacterium]|nr:DctP family TRAP transporter solute-binding subunit [Pseudomonadota bacterium]